MVKYILATMVSTFIMAQSAMAYTPPGIKWGSNKGQIQNWAYKQKFTSKGPVPDGWLYIKGEFADRPTDALRVGYCNSGGLHTAELHYFANSKTYLYIFQDLFKAMSAKYGKGQFVNTYSKSLGVDPYYAIKSGQAEVYLRWVDRDNTLVGRMCHTIENQTTTHFQTVCKSE